MLYQYRYRILIHGVINGFSRLVFSLKVATNNRANMVWAAFIEGVQIYGLHSRVRYEGY